MWQLTKVRCCSARYSTQRDLSSRRENNGILISGRVARRGEGSTFILEIPARCASAAPSIKTTDKRERRLLPNERFITLSMGVYLVAAEALPRIHQSPAGCLLAAPRFVALN